MLAVIGISFAPLFGFMIFGLFLIIFPNAALYISQRTASMKGSIYFTDSAILITRITGFVFILLGIGIFMLINGWLDFLIN